MANYATLKSAIQSVVRTNGNNEITGALLQQTLFAMVNSLGADYQFVGVATPTTTPGTPDQNVFYVGGPGTYPNFDGAIVPDGGIGFFKYNGTWDNDIFNIAKDFTAILFGGTDVLAINWKTGGYYTSSGNFVSGGGIYTEKIDVSLYDSLIVGGVLGTTTRYTIFYNANNEIVFVRNESSYSVPETIDITQIKYVAFSFASSAQPIISGQTGGVIPAINNDISLLQNTVSSFVANINDLLERALVFRVSSKNLHNSAPVVVSTTQPINSDWAAHSLNASGAFIANNNTYNLSYYIPVEYGNTYKSNVALRHVAFYDSNKQYIENSYVNNQIAANTAIPVPSGASYIIIQYAYSLAPQNVKFGKYADDISDDYEMGDYDKFGRKLVTEETPDYILLGQRVTDLENQAVGKKLNVLLIGSSFGVNTMVQFPAIAIAGGIDLIGGNLYTGGATLNDIINIINGDGNFETGRVYTKQTNSWQTVTNNITAMLALYEWDIIIVQRAAPNKTGGSDSWTTEMANELNTILQFIQANINNQPKIMFNSVFCRSVGYFNGSRENQIASAELIMSTAKKMQEQFGLEIIPAAIAIQNARETSLSYVPTFNSAGYSIPDLTGLGDHLDTGVGSYILGCLLFEQIIGKRFDLSVLNVDTLPTLANVTNNGCFADSNFTQITAQQARIARYAAMCAVRDPWNISTEIGNLFPYPTN